MPDGAVGGNTGGDQQSIEELEELRIERIVSRVLSAQQGNFGAAAQAAEGAAALGGALGGNAGKVGNMWSAKAIATTTQHTVGFITEMLDETLPRFLIFLAIALFFGLMAVASGPLIQIVLSKCLPGRFGRFIAFLAQIGLVVIGIAIALAANDIDLWRILLSFGIIGLILSSGFGSVMSNLIAGLSLPFDPEIDIGSEISVSDVRGVIVAMDLLATLVRRTDVQPRQPQQQHEEIASDTGSVRHLSRTTTAYTLVPNHFFSDLPVTVYLVSATPADEDVLIQSLSNAAHSNRYAAQRIGGTRRRSAWQVEQHID